MLRVGLVGEDADEHLRARAVGRREYAVLVDAVVGHDVVVLLQDPGDVAGVAAPALTAVGRVRKRPDVGRVQAVARREAHELRVRVPAGVQRDQQRERLRAVVGGGEVMERLTGDFDLAARSATGLAATGARRRDRRAAGAARTTAPGRPGRGAARAAATRRASAATARATATSGARACPRCPSCPQRRSCPRRRSSPPGRSSPLGPLYLPGRSSPRLRPNLPGPSCLRQPVVPTVPALPGEPVPAEPETPRLAPRAADCATQ